LPTLDLDLLVLGSGVAGLSAAVLAADTHRMRVGVLTKAELHQTTTRWAQGGVAAVLGGADPDSTDLHHADTLAAGGGLCDPDAVRVLVDEGPRRVNELIAMGARFDVDADGRLARSREGGHTVPRIIHAGGAATGAEIERALVEEVHDSAAVVHEHAFAVDLIVESGRCAGVSAIEASGARLAVRARHVLVATGGAGQLFAVTTNPVEATGDGVAMALRAGVPVADVEFVQFHPTALHHPAMPRPLLSEALRGHGALLRDTKGERFVDELLPRDAVSRAMAARMLAQDVDHLWLDATGLERFRDRFPTIAAALGEAGLDPAVDWLPIAPAAHYSCGGILTDLDGATALPGLWAAGEVANNGVHGANRLASNSLLDGMVFAPRVVEAIERGKDEPEATGALRAVLVSTEADLAAVPGELVVWPRPEPAPAPERVDDGRDALQRAMTAGAGVLRSAGSLARAADAVGRAAAGSFAAPDPPDRAAHELANLADVGSALVAAAAARRESRGAHTRTDFPETTDHGRVRFVIVPGPQLP
jgi:L-aspartate oxidase